MSAVRIKMEAEWQESPDAVRRQAQALHAPLAELLRRIRGHPPNFVLTCARGSSAHSATFGKHLVERHLGIPVGAFAPNMATIYKQRLKLNGQLFLTVSQSGRSDDLIESAAMAKTAGALTVAIVNDTDSPLARSSDIVLPMAAGPELSVTATKSFVTSLSAWLHVVAGVSGAIAGPTCGCDAARLEHGVKDSVRGEEPSEHWTRTHARDRAGGRTEVEGNVQPPCRSIQRR